VVKLVFADDPHPLYLVQFFYLRTVFGDHVVGKNEFYHKETGRRLFAENTRRRLLLETIEAIGGLRTVFGDHGAGMGFYDCHTASQRAVVGLLAQIAWCQKRLLV
jgi:hypothetical protein